MFACDRKCSGINSLLSSGGAFTTTVEVGQQRPSEGYEMHQFNTMDTMDSQGMEERARSEPPQVCSSTLEVACVV